MVRSKFGILVVWLVVWQAVAVATQDETLRVHVSIEPLQYLVERVGGAHVDVGVVVEAGQPPETYEPTPRQIGALSDSRVFFGVGMPLEDSWRRQVTGDDATEQAWIDLSRAPKLRRDAGDHEGHDPHIWLSPVEAQRMVEDIADVLGRVDPRGASDYRANAARLQEELQSLQREIEEILAKSGVRTFLVFHPAWGHFADDFGLEQIAIEAGGKEPGAKGIVEVIRRAKSEHITTLFVDPRHSTRLAETVAEAIGGDIEILDPLAYDYMNNLLHAARTIAASRS